MMSWLEAPARFIVFTPLYLLFAVIAFATHSYRRWMKLLSSTVLIALGLWLLSAYNGRIVLFSLPEGSFIGVLLFYIFWMVAGRFLTNQTINGLFKKTANYCREAILSPLPPEEPQDLQATSLVEEEPETVEYLASIAPEKTTQSPSAAAAFEELPDSLKQMILNQP